MKSLFALATAAAVLVGAAVAAATSQAATRGVYLDPTHRVLCSLEPTRAFCKTFPARPGGHAVVYQIGRDGRLEPAGGCDCFLPLHLIPKPWPAPLAYGHVAVRAGFRLASTRAGMLITAHGHGFLLRPNGQATVR